MERLQEYFQRRLKETPLEFTRYKYDDIKWDGRMLGLVGPRGVGKSTLLLQRIKREMDTADTLYVTADHLYFSEHTLLELADRFVKMGGKHLFIDEIHKYEHWSRELKLIYDSYADLQVVFTGSSVLDILHSESDLSRRAPIYKMQGLSFREYLHLFQQIEVPALSLDDILAHNAEALHIDHPLMHFAAYLRTGYYPFSRDVDFETELSQVIAQTMEVDIPQYARMNVAAGRKLKQLLVVLAKSVPFKPVFQKLADATGISRNAIGDYLYYMERAGLIAQAQDATGGLRGLGKTEKLYLDNTNLAYLLGANATDVGNLRETFFFNQMRVHYEPIASKVADFQIDDLTFEVGGRKKGQRQIEGVEKGYIVKDDIEYGYSNVVPLWAFGLTY